MEGSRFVPPPSKEWQDRNPGHTTVPPDDRRWGPDPKDQNGDLRKLDPKDQNGDLRKPWVKPMPVVWFHDIEMVKTTTDFVQGLLCTASSAVVYGESNSGKTFWALDLALHVAAGKEWNGRRVDQGGVLYCILEGTQGFRNRVVAWREKHCHPTDKVHFGAIAVGMDLRNPEGDTAELIRIIKQSSQHLGQPVKLIVVDTLSRALAGGNENDSAEMGALVACIDLIREETGACVLLVHHSGKDAAKGARGHSLLRAAIDTEIEVKADDTGTRTATVCKQREMENGGRFGFQLDKVVLGQTEDHGEDITTCVVLPTEAPSSTAKAMKLNPETETLKREIGNALEAMKGETVTPAPGFPKVVAITQKRLRARLIEVGWVNIGLSGVSGGVSIPETIPKPELTRLWKRLTELKSKDIVCFNREYVWMARK